MKLVATAFASLRSRAFVIAVFSLGVALHSTAGARPTAPRVTGETWSTPPNKAALVENQWISPFPETVGNLSFAQVSPDRIESAQRWNESAKLRAQQVGIQQLASEELISSSSSNWRTAANGGRILQFSVTTPGAKSVRVLLRFASLDVKAELRVGGNSSEIFREDATGIFRSTNDKGAYWTAVTPGDTQYVELYLPPESRGVPSVVVDAVMHDFASYSDNFKSTVRQKAVSDFCQNDAVCLPQTQAYVTTAASVAHMVFVAGCGTGGTQANCVCTGTLLNDTDTTTQIPYFYSASHCISTQSSASTLTTYWRYENATCNPLIGNGRSVATPVSGGADLLYTSLNNDGTFLRLRNNPPSGTGLAGWDASTIIGGTPITVVHHPAGDTKKASLGQVFFSPFSVRLDANGDGSTQYIQVGYTSGSTEGGSSGAGLFTQSSGNYYLRGGLWGGSASCLNSGKLNDSSARDLFSRFDLVYPFIKGWLSPSTPSTPTVPTTARTGVDIDGDGRQEIVVRNGNGQVQLGRLSNNSITFTAQSAPSTSFRLVGAGDFDGNGQSDLAFQNMTQGELGDVRIWPSFSSASERLWRQVKQVWDVQAVGDMDGDGKADLVWRYVVPNSPDTGVSYIWFTNGT